METIIIAFVVITSILYVVMQHLFNWGIRIAFKNDKEHLGGFIILSYILFSFLYWISLIQALKLIL